MMPRKCIKGDCKVNERRSLGWDVLSQILAGKEGWESTPGRWGSNSRNKGSGMGPWLLCWGLNMQFHFSGTEWPQNKEKVITFWNQPGDGALTLHWGVWIYYEHSEVTAGSSTSEIIWKWCLRKWLNRGQDETRKSEANICEGKLWRRDVLKWLATSKRMCKWSKSWAKKKKKRVWSINLNTQIIHQ